MNDKDEYMTIQNIIFLIYFRINNTIESAIELDVDSHHSLTALHIKGMNVWRMF